MRKIRRTLIPLLLLASVFATTVLAAPTQSQLEQQKKQAEKERINLWECFTGCGITLG